MEHHPTPLYQHLGPRAFWVFFFRNSKFLFATLGFLIIGILVFHYIILDARYTSILVQGIYLAIGFFFIIIVFSLLSGWISYIAFKFVLDTDALRIKSGIFNIQADAIPYRQIQNVDIERDIFYRALGVSRLVILTAGQDDHDVHGESAGVIPALDKYLAEQLQSELIKRSNIAKVVDVKELPVPVVGDKAIGA
jgi:uncharacterized membrane protein YdbT with pleckstrin-like domain